VILPWKLLTVFWWSNNAGYFSLSPSASSG
jgi:hypothetical protein